MEADGVVVVVGAVGGKELCGAVGDAEGVGDGGGGEGALDCFEGAGAGGGVFVGDVGRYLAGAVNGVPAGVEGSDEDFRAGSLRSVKGKCSVRAIDVEAGGDERDIAGAPAAGIVELDVALSAMVLDNLREGGLKHGDGVCAGQVYTRKCVRQWVGRE